MVKDRSDARDAMRAPTQETGRVEPPQGPPEPPTGKGHTAAPEAQGAAAAPPDPAPQPTPAVPAPDAWHASGPRGPAVLEAVAGQQPDLKDSLVLVAFPTTGFAGPIAAHYLLRRLELPLVGHVRLPGLTSVVSIHQGIATTPVRVFGGEVACNLDDGCPRVYLVASDLPAPPPVLRLVADAVLDAARKDGARLILALEGVVREAGDETPDVYCAAARPEVLKKIREAAKVPVPERAVIAGLTGELLLGSTEDGPDVASLLVEASRDFPDGRAAAALIEVLDRLIPHVDVDVQPLLDEAMELEKEIHDAQRDAEQRLRRSDHHGTYI